MRNRILTAIPLTGALQVARYGVMWCLCCQDPAQTQALGAALGKIASPGTTVLMQGDLGAGKTCFAQGVGAGLQVRSDIVSPTFVLIAEHEGRLPLLHADVYRLEEAELEGVGLEELLEDWEGVAIVEWGDRFPEIFPRDHLQVRLRIEGEARRVEVTATGPVSADTLARWRLCCG